MSKKYDLVGKTFGKLTVRKKAEKPNCKKKEVYWECVCECGNVVIRSTEKLMRTLKEGRESSCGCNSGSSGEKMVEYILKAIKVECKKQYTFDDCIDKQRLRFDFAIFKNDKLSCLIEYDGKQHYEPIEYFGGIDEYQDRVRKDNIKNEYCKNNFIPLYRFTYAESKDDIEKKITNIVNRNDCGTFMVT